MSKKKPTAPIPLTGVVTITTDGRTTLAMKASHRGEDIEVSTGLSHCRPGDVYSEYEGARIALARLYGLDPFPQEDKPQEDKPQEEAKPQEDKPQEKGRWEKATKENCKDGSRVRVIHEVNSFGTYKDGDTGVVGSWYSFDMVNVKFDGKSEVPHPACFLRELEVWVPDTQEEAKPQEAPIPEAPKPFTPSFQVGDIVRLSETADLFHPSCRGKVGKVIQASETPFSGEMYSLAVNLKPGEVGHQYCTEWPNEPAPLELLFRDPQKDGEKA